MFRVQTRIPLLVNHMSVGQGKGPAHSRNPSITHPLLGLRPPAPPTRAVIAAPAAGTMSTSRDDPDELARQAGVKEGQAWVNYDKGLSKGRGNGGTFYQAEGPRKWSHDEVYDQNPELEAAVGTADQPMPSIFDCTQGTVGKGRHGEGTNQQKLRQLSNGGDAEV